MKSLLTIILSLLTIVTIAATRFTNGTGGGNFSNPATWACNCIPSSTDDVVVEDSDSLIIDTTVTVDEFRYSYSDNPTAVIINLGDTLYTTNDFKFLEPFTSDATANLIINGVLDIGVSAGHDLRIFFSNNEDHLTINIEVNGSLIIEDNFTHNSGAASNFNILNIEVNGYFEVNGDFDATFLPNNCQFNFTNNGTVVSGDWTISGLGTDEVFNIINNSTADLTTSQFQFSLEDDDSKVIIDNDGIISAQSTRLFAESNFDTIQVFCRNGSSYSNTSFVDFGNTIGDNLEFSFNIENGAAFSTGSYISFEAQDFANIDFDIDGELNIDGELLYFQLDNSNGTLDISSTGELTSQGLDFEFAGDNTFAFTANSTLNVAGDLDIIAAAGDDITFDFNESVYPTNRFFQSTAGASSSIVSNFLDSLMTPELRIDVNAAATGTENEVNIDHSNAVVSVERIRLGAGSGTLVSGTSNNSTVIFTGTATGDSIPARSSIEYDNVIISKTGVNGIALRWVLNNLNGDLTITAGAELELNSNGELNVGGDFTNSGTLETVGNPTTITGNFSNTSIVNNSTGSWSVGGNFLNIGTFNNFGDAQKFDITGDFTNFSTFDAQIDSLVIGGNFSNGATYSSDTNDIFLSGNWSNTGTYTSRVGDVVTFQGSSAQTISGTSSIDEMVINNTSGGVSITSGTTSIASLLTLTNGALTTNGNMVFLSTSNRTAALAQVTGGTISGDVTVQRFLDEGNGWYMLASPVSGATLADWNTELPMSGFVGSDEPANPWTSVYSYDETSRLPSGLKDSGYVAATNTTNSLVPGEGWFVYFEDVKSGATAQTMDVTGPLVTGTVNLTSLTFSSDGPAGDNGWHMLGNPYASPVEWDLINKINILNDEGYVMGSNGSYRDIINDGVDYLYSSEAFWVETDNATGSLEFNETNKSIRTDSYNSKLKASPYSLPLKIELTTAKDTGFIDYSVLRFGNNTTFTSDFDKVSGADSRKLSNALPMHANVSSFSKSDSSDVYYNTLNDLDSSDVIPLRIWKQYPAYIKDDFTLNFIGIEEWDRNNKCLVLHDLETNTIQKLNANSPDYTFNSFDTLQKPRIELKLKTPLDIEVIDASCYGFNDGIVNIQGEGTGTHDYTWLDQNNNVLLKELNKSGVSSLSNLAPGTYTVWVTDNGECGTVGATVTIKEPNEIIALFDLSEDTVYLNVNTPVEFTNNSVYATDYTWDFGDGTTSNLQNPIHQFKSGGLFDVTLIATNQGCYDTLIKQVNVINNVSIAEISPLADRVNIFQRGNRTYVSFDLQDEKNASITMYDVIGKSIINPVILSGIKNQQVELKIPNNLSGIYSVTVYIDNDKLTKKLFYTMH